MIGGKIKIMREMKNLTQEFVSEKLDMSQANYSRLERDEIELTIQKAKKIAEVLDIKLTDLIDLNEKNVFNISKVDTINSDCSISYSISAELKTLYDDKIRFLEEKIAQLEGKK